MYEWMNMRKKERKRGKKQEKGGIPKNFDNERTDKSNPQSLYLLDLLVHDLQLYKKVTDNRYPPPPFIKTPLKEKEKKHSRIPKNANQPNIQKCKMKPN